MLQILSKDDAKKIIDKVLEISTANETEVHLGCSSSALTRFADNHIHQNVAGDSFGLTVVAVLGKQMGEAHISKFDDDSLKKVVADAIELAKVSPPDPELLPRPEPQTYRGVQSYYDGTITPMERAEGVAKVVRKSKNAQLTAAGIFSNGVSCSAMGNSKGLFASYTSSSVAFSTTVMSDDSSGWAEKTSKRKSDVEPDELAEIAIRKAELSKKPLAVEPGKYTVILEPAASAGLLRYLASGFNALAVDEGRSYLVGKSGERIVGEEISIASDVYHPLHQGRPYDGEGIPTKRVDLFKDGVVTQLVYDRLTAKNTDLNQPDTEAEGQVSALFPTA